MIDGKPAWRDAEIFPEDNDLFLMISGAKPPFSYNLVWWTWYKPWFRPQYKVWRSHRYLISEPQCYLRVGDLLKLPIERRARAAQIESDLEQSRDQQRASAVRGITEDAAN